MADIMPAAGLPRCAASDFVTRRSRAERAELRAWCRLTTGFCGAVAFLLAALGII